MSWWHRKPAVVDPNVVLIQLLKDEIARLHQQHNVDLQRIDRLMEGLARRANVDLVMPSPDLPPAEKVYVPNPWKDPNRATFEVKETKQ